MTTATRALIDHALSRRWRTLSQPARDAACLFFEDTLCVGIAGRNAAHADAVLAVAHRWGGGGAARVLGRPGTRLTPAYAAFVNAFQIHAQEYDCVHEAAVAHPLATVLAALLSATAGRKTSGSDLLTALVAGTDIVAALGIAVTTPLKFFRPATAGVFGSTAALARLHQLDGDTAQAAFGHALAFTGGTMQAHVEGKPGLALQVGAAARSAVEAVDLAMAGVPAPIAAIEGPFGFGRLFEDGFDADRMVSELATRERICELSWKPFPTGRAAQGAIVALQAMMRSDGVSIDSVHHWTYRAPPLIARLVGRRPIADMSPAYARLCLPYLAAVTLRRGTVGLDDFDAASLSDPTTLALAERFVVEVDDNPDPAAFVPAMALADLLDGRHVAHQVNRQFGAPDWPLSLAEHGAKAYGCLAFGGLADRAAALREVVATIASVEDIDAALAPAFGE